METGKHEETGKQSLKQVYFSERSLFLGNTCFFEMETLETLMETEGTEETKDTLDCSLRYSSVIFQFVSQRKHLASGFIVYRRKSPSQTSQSALET